MANGNKEQEDKQPIQHKHARKTYVKPAFRFERVFTTSALACGKTDATEFLCKTNRKTS
jgi:hypothetical protein